jgi:hypothetical protein
MELDELIARRNERIKGVRHDGGRFVRPYLRSSYGAKVYSGWTPAMETPGSTWMDHLCWQRVRILC